MEGIEVIQKALPIIVGIVWVLAAVFKKRNRTPIAGKSADGAAGTAPRATLFDELRRSFNAALEEVTDEQMVTETAASAVEPQPQMASTSAVYDSYQRGDATLERSLSEQEALSIEKRGRRAATISQPAQLQILSSLSVGKGPKMVLNRDKLREGILLSEILSPPVSLRE